MKISKLIEKLEALKAEHGDTEVRGVAPMDNGFLHCNTVNHRNKYHDESFFGGLIEKGNFVVIDWERDV